MRRCTTERGLGPRALGATLALLLPMLLAVPSPVAAEGGEEGRYRLRVNGLACPFCAYGIEKKLGGLEGVRSVEVSLDEGAVIVRTRPGTALTEERARRAVEDAGFGLQGFQVLTPPGERGLRSQDESHSSVRWGGGAQTVTRWLRRSVAKTRPSGATATAMAWSKAPGPQPSSPKLVRKVPSAANFWIRWL